MIDFDEGRYVDPSEDIAIEIKAETCILVLSGSLYDAILHDERNTFAPIENYSNNRLNFAYDGAGILLHFPLYGSPRIASAIEQLGAIGIRCIIALGFCGSMGNELEVGQLVVASAAVRTDSVGEHYAPKGYPAFANTRLLGNVVRATGAKPVLQLSTDALYRETYSYIDQWRKLSVDTIDMETATLYVVARTLGIEAIWTGIVSDILEERKHIGSDGGINAIQLAIDVAQVLVDMIKRESD